MRWNPYLDSNLDIVETVLTMILLFLACCGIFFSAYAPAKGLELSSWEHVQVESLSWLSYLSMILGSLLCASLLANEFLDLILDWYLNRVKFLGDTSADLEQVKGKLMYSKSALAHVEVPLPSSNVEAEGSSLASDALQRLKATAKRRLSVMGSYVMAPCGADKEVSSKDTKLFYQINLLRFRKAMQGFDPSDRPS